ncbi:MAG: hypothetical protein HDT44_07045 [Ruminococcaceae bacterium]|nr:hypothetical protein [Oscillospiraceae bacterium]
MNGKKDNKSKNIPVNRGNDSSQYPNKTKEPQYLNYIVTDNITTENGCVRNKDDIDAKICRDEVNANKK